MVKFISNSFSTTLNVVKKGTVVMLCMVLMGLFFAVGCKKDDGKKDTKSQEELCLYLNSENIDKTLPIINEFLADLPNSNSFSEDEQNLQALAEWLKSSPCVIDATVLCVSCILTDPAQSEVSFSFQEGEITKIVTLDISMSKPLKAGICAVQEVSNVTLKNTESYSRTFVSGDEEGAIILYQAQHYEKSELVRDESTNMSVEYHYKPAIDFVGTDSVGLEIYYNKTGEGLPYIETVRINFTITN
jgi:hypothetical protein